MNTQAFFNQAHIRSAFMPTGIQRDDPAFLEQSACTTLFRSTRGVRSFGFGRNEEIDEIIQQAKQAGLTQIGRRQLWQIQSRQLEIMACHMFESTDVQRHPAGTTFVLILRPDQMYEIARLVSRMSFEEIGSVFDPRRGGQAITVIVASNPARRVMSVNLTERQDYKLPLPPKLLRANQRCGEEGAIKFSGLENLFISASHSGHGAGRTVPEGTSW